ncbi:hypothetical protein FJT64_016555 [Amphibalanus amphitrite]|uniref:Uncharacterized protein n=1 Tax=Amphibalanus amphitrite TaxID=1232801 RepID=A0A6A4VCQ2_AMPAM|nr:hypothetical protein FJT64_013410 [Amphibalanus amphitrite]KAF0312799.1 hypothetical protein FJT64_016555 [Amphibalanus amphitrite]
MFSSPVFVCALLVAGAAASSVPVSQRARGGKIDGGSESFFRGGFQPSVAVPLERRSDSHTAASTSSYQANLPAVVITVLLVIGTIVIVPLIASKLFGLGSSSFLNLGGYGRSEDGGADLTSLMSLLDEALQKHDVDATSCMQLGVCSYVRRAALDIVEGRADSTDLIVDGISSNPLLSSWLDGTSILEASNVGRSGADCAQTYGTCSLNAASVVSAVGDLISRAN